MNQSLLLASVEKSVAWSWTFGRKLYLNAVWQSWTGGLLADNGCTLCNLPSVSNEPAG